jgi:hypothetical protein
MPAGRSSIEIRASVQETRRDLEYSVNDLKGKIAELTDWRRQLIEHKQQALIGAGAAGFILGGGIAGFVGLFKRG